MAMRKRRKVLASRETESHLKKFETNKLEVYSFFPIDPPHDENVHKHITRIKADLQILEPDVRKQKMNQMGHYENPRDKTGMKRYRVVCNYCDAVQGFLWTDDLTLHDWCDFHYYLYSDGNEWYGCHTPHISPIDGTLLFECTCGQDIRDFRANMTLPSAVAYEKEQDNKRGREFGKRDSKFRLEEIEALPEMDLYPKRKLSSLQRGRNG